ncbi:MAG: xanthine dehydrogenase family protein subunit M [Deltaproteobacteria bacterium]|nr:xanthine dehydrogenase family protein subunit M [Deltaproteobacteria bacterium]
MGFEYLEPRTIEEAVALLSRHNGKAKVIAGGTDLMNQVRLKAIKPEYLVDIGRIPGLDDIRYDEKGRLSIGARTPIRAIERSPEILKNHPVIAQAAGALGSMAIRNVGTVGGNLCNAAPSADTAPALIGLGASVKIFGPEGKREVFLEDFFTGSGTTILRRGELLAEIRVPPMSRGMKGVYLKHSIKGTADLAVVGVAAIATPEGNQCKDMNIILGAVAPTPMRARKSEAAIKGREIDSSLIDAVARMAAEESRPIRDVRASAEYRKEMVKVFTGYALKSVLGR